MRIGDQRVGRRRAVLRQDLVELMDETRGDQDVVGGIPLFDERDADRYHGMSSWPVCMFTARASTNNKSDSRFREWMITGLIGCLRARVTTERSARRQTA